MVDDTHNNSVVATEEDAEGAVGAAVADHPHAGTPEEGWSAPVPGSEGADGFATLVVKRGGAETELAFSVCSPCIIGRFDAAVGPIDIDLGSMPEGSYVSRKHARISCENGTWKIEDMGSSNGTFVLRSDFERVTEADLEDGTEIALGNARFVFHLKTDADACATPEA